jgi:ubiquinone/menaquinone biosynthesis C-methylase UbiE
MKDIVQNRQRIALASKVRLAWISLIENGALYCFYLGISYFGASLSDFGFRKSDELRRSKNLPGVNSRTANKYIWENWDWSAKGEEWTLDPLWKASVVKTFIDAYFKELGTVVEIGPGAGRWTEHLIERVGRLVGIDISETCVAECQNRFSSSHNATFEVGNGRDLSSVATGSVDGIWSFDVFVHINGDEFRSYVGEFARILKSGGVGVIHHGLVGGSSGGWRSNVTRLDVSEYLKQYKLEIKSQVTSWVDDGIRFEAGLYGDAITVFQKN